MNEVLKERCELLADNRDAVHKTFKFDDSIMSIVAATVFTNAGIAADSAKLKECKAILNREEGVFSDFRGNLRQVILSKMAVAEDPEAYLHELKSIYRKLNDEKVFGSEHTALAAIIICDGRDESEAEEVEKLTVELTARIKELHPARATNSDLAVAALMALSGRDGEELLTDLEDCYAIMKERFPSFKDAAYSLSQILTISRIPAQVKCDKCIEIYDALKERVFRYGKEYQLASLAALAEVNVDTDILAEEIADAEQYLATRKGFAGRDISKESRLMFAALQAAEVHAADGVVSLAIAEELAIVVNVMMSLSALNSVATKTSLTSLR